MKRFFADRGMSLALVVAVMVLITVSQGGISYSIVLGALRDRVTLEGPEIAVFQWGVRAAFLCAMVALWIMKRKRALFRVIILANAFLTLVLLGHTAYLISVLHGSAQAGVTLITDVALMAMSNILIFSIWYWIIDPPGVVEGEDANQPWAFLFPQRGGPLPNYESWTPRYADYLFVAFTTSFAFSPTDAAPLTRTAKMLMLFQAVISVVTLTGVAGAAINILAG